MARYYQQHYHRRYKGYSDLRDFLDEKHQREGDYNTQVPEDPHSILKDPLRGDAPSTSTNSRPPRYEFYRGRGGFQRRPFAYLPRGRGRNPGRGMTRGMPPNPTNIKVEFSTESGERKCTVQSDDDISSRFNTNNTRGRGYRGRRFRAYFRRPRGNRGSYNRRPTLDDEKPLANSVIRDEQEENWDLPQQVEEKDVAGAPQEACGEEIRDNEVYHEGDEVYHEDDPEGDESYHEVDEAYHEDEETYQEEYTESEEYTNENEDGEAETPSKIIKDEKEVEAKLTVITDVRESSESKVKMPDSNNEIVHDATEKDKENKSDTNNKKDDKKGGSEAGETPQLSIDKKSPNNNETQEKNQG